MTDSPREKMLRKFRRYGGGPGSALFRAVNAALMEAADLVKSDAHHLISRGSVEGRNHAPSKPGEPPNRETGTLQAHIEVTQPKPLVSRVASEASYAAALEFGTSKMAARPYMRPARDRKREEARRRLNKHLKILKGK
ncbi:hypothetical protein GCM10011371_08370 [Novosphingobium marinum]|uniref:HK97 gp10 family phage protein n=1 Tax=Novosphingobium marinum TaxID=1514948 RepID=A0A7Y9XU15_9SPHN|nr:HK97-gp10 family putative phage morphogenesis protein [Novosphingobium marinum]NYH94525.1 HK97 gp10 family phage protein [Novosphingobium marinum]GGC23009.1 hypothetical protein GCM10011371_08370 [Novosphingobium marinum]